MAAVELTRRSDCSCASGLNLCLIEKLFEGKEGVDSVRWLGSEHWSPPFWARQTPTRLWVQHRRWMTVVQTRMELCG